MTDTDVCSHTLPLPESDPAVAAGDGKAKHLTEDDPGVWDDVWHCPRETLDGHNKCLLLRLTVHRMLIFFRRFFAPLSPQIQSQTRSTGDVINNLLISLLMNFVLRGELIGNDSRSYADFRYSKFANVDCSRAELLQRMRFAHCTFVGSDDVESPLTDPDSRYDFSDIESIMFNLSTPGTIQTSHSRRSRPQSDSTGISMTCGYRSPRLRLSIQLISKWRSSAGWLHAGELNSAMVRG